MKRFVFIILLFLPVVVFAQAPIQVSSPYQYNKYVKVLDSLVSKNIIIPRVSAFPTPKQSGQIVNKQDTVCFWNGSAWIRIRKVTWPEDSVRYASKSGVAADTAKLHNQIITKLAITDTIPIHNQIITKQPQLSGTGFVKSSGTTITYDNSTYQPAGSYVLTSDTARYISKSQARKDIHDSIAPLKVDVNYLKQLTDTTSELVARTIYVSLPNDPQTPGSDVSGNGTISLPFATINKALSTIKNYVQNIQITINLDSGSFYINDRDLLILKLLKYKAADAPVHSPIIILGNTRRIVTGFTSTATSNPFIVSVNTTLTPDAYINYALGTNTSLLCPIESNTTNTITTCRKITTGTSIYRLNTTLLTNNLTIVSDRALTINSCNVQGTSISLQGVALTMSVIKSTATTGFGIGVHNSLIVYCNIMTNITAISGSTDGIYIQDSELRGASIIYTGTAKTTGTGLGIRGYPGISAYSNIIISNYALGLHCSALPPSTGITGANNIYFKNCGTCISNIGNPGAPIDLSFFNNIYTVNSDYLIRTYSNSKVVVNSATSLNLPVYHPSSLNKSFTNIYSMTSVNVPGIYSEYQQNQNTTLTNNSTDSISIADLSYNRSINIDYTITRNGQYRTGSMKVLNTGTTYLFDPGDYIESADVGVTFQGVYRSGNSNTLKLKWTTTNTGQNASIQCDYRRQNF